MAADDQRVRGPDYDLGDTAYGARWHAIGSALLNELPSQRGTLGTCVGNRCVGLDPGGRFPALTSCLAFANSFASSPVLITAAGFGPPSSKVHEPAG